jgi:hypothetical protein
MFDDDEMLGAILDRLCVGGFRFKVQSRVLGAEKAAPGSLYEGEVLESVMFEALVSMPMIGGHVDLVDRVDFAAAVEWAHIVTYHLQESPLRSALPYDAHPNGDPYGLTSWFGTSRDQDIEGSLHIHDNLALINDAIQAVEVVVNGVCAQRVRHLHFIINTYIPMTTRHVTLLLQSIAAWPMRTCPEACLDLVLSQIAAEMQTRPRDVGPVALRRVRNTYQGSVVAGRRMGRADVRNEDPVFRLSLHCDSAGSCLLDLAM